MTDEKVYAMQFSRVYPCLVAKAERKGRTRQEVDAITCWLTGYTEQALADILKTPMTYGDFFRNAPQLNPNRRLITGSICGIRVENMEPTLMQEMRYLDKLVDELAKGKTLDRILRK